MPNYLPEDFIEEVRVANEITDVLSEYLTLKPKGKNYFGLCPFHNEKDALFFRRSREAIVSLFRLRRGWQCIHFYYGPGEIGFYRFCKISGAT